MFPLLRVALRIQDMLILLAIGCVLLSVVYLLDLFRAELKKSSVDKTNFTPWHAPQFHFLMMALMVGIAGVFTPADQVMDWQIHDVYFIISLPIVGVVAAAYLLFVSLVYFMARRLSLLRWMAVLHLSLTAAAGILFYLYAPSPPAPTDMFDQAWQDSFQVRNVIIGFSFIVAALSQVLLPINLLIGWWRR